MSNIHDKPTHHSDFFRHDTTPEIWQETYLSAILRAVLYADDPNYRLAGFRKLDPITTPEGELRFLQAAEALFFKGWQLGSDPEIQVASIVSNHLTSGLMKYFGDSFRYDQAANLFEKLYARESEVASLLARSYIGMSELFDLVDFAPANVASLSFLDEEVKAIQIISSALQENPQLYPLLHAQIDFLRCKTTKSQAALSTSPRPAASSPISDSTLTWAIAGVGIR